MPPKKVTNKTRRATPKAKTAKPAPTRAKPTKNVAKKPAKGAKAGTRRSLHAALDREMAGVAGHKRPKPAIKNEGPAFGFAVDAARLMRDDKCENVVLLDVRGHSQVTDFVILGSGTSERQMRSVLHHVEELGAQRGFQAYGTNTDDRASWVLVDFVEVVVHLFEPNTRAHYNLESLWPKAKHLQWERPDQLERDRAGLHA